MKLARGLLIVAALLLTATALFHASGGAMVRGWLPGSRGAIVGALWYIPTVDWLTIAALWAFAAWRGDGRLAPAVWIVSAAPLLAAAMLARAVGPGFPGIWMLLGAGALAIGGALLLPRR